MILTGSVFKIFPLADDPDNKWVVPHEFHQILGHGAENAELYDEYIMALKHGVEKGHFDSANERISNILEYQRKVAGYLLPSERKASVEILYNKANIFKRLFPFYMAIGSVLIALFFTKVFKPTIEFKLLNKVMVLGLAICFLLQTIGLGVRWYIAGHAPWSNGYESMIYISWATMLAGFIFMKRSGITLGVTAMLTGIALLTAHMSWLNPEITNLVPVLKSYWLTIHVATITASYGFLALGGMVALLNLCIMIFRNNLNFQRLELNIRELSLIIELSLSVGLILLIIGNFLGAIWANESWGRYWGWDPKETWTLVTIILYSFTLHLPLIPRIYNKFIFNVMAIFSFGAVLMTYFGVNYYLSGLHSYAAGDSVPIPAFVYFTIILFFSLVALAAYNEYGIGRSRDK
jgi:cytochrome c-type biogenesis protein CcsB